jgi:hypothetical protein
MPCRFTSLCVQVQNLKKPEVENFTAAIDAVRTGSLKHMQSCGYARPLEIIGDISRATVIAASGNRLFDVDLSGIESRGLALLPTSSRSTNGENSTKPARKRMNRITSLNRRPKPRQRHCPKYGNGDLAFGYQGGTGMAENGAAR